MRILFIGDIVGKVGRRIVKEKVPEYVKKYGIDFVIANGENTTHGTGLNYHHYEELLSFYEIGLLFRSFNRTIFSDD